MITTPCPPIGTPLFAPRETYLAPSMLIGRGQVDQPWVLNHPHAGWHYLGRNASYALVKGLGLGAGSEMLFPAFFGPPVLDAPVNAGASIRFYPVRAGLRVDIEDIRAALTAQTRAIYLIHFNGFPGPIGDVMELARERNLLVIEDCAHALLTDVDGQAAGSFGDGAVFSFYKWAPVPNGAALVTKRAPDPSMPVASRRSVTSGVALSVFSVLNHAEQNWGKPGAIAKQNVRAFGRTVSRSSSLAYVSTGGVEFHTDELDYAMSAVSHRILANQRWDRIASQRRQNYAYLADLLDGIAPPLQGTLHRGVTPLFYATAVEDKRAVLSRLAARGIEGRNFWERHVPSLPPGIYPETDELRRTTLELPIHQDLDGRDIERIAAAVQAIVGARTQWVAPELIAS